MGVPIQTRCPSCAAAISSTATWCSLCHADLRARREARSSATTVVPSSHLPGGPPRARAAASAGDLAVADPVHDPDPSIQSADDLEPGADEPRGRHSRDAGPPALVEDPEPGRHSHGRPGARGASSRSAQGRRTRSAATLMDLGGVEIPTGDQVTPEQVDVVAEQMLTRLKLSEPPSRLLDPNDLPGGKWAIMGAGTLVVILALLVVYTLLGLVFGD